MSGVCSFLLLCFSYCCCCYCCCGGDDDDDVVVVVLEGVYVWCVCVSVCV